MVTVVRFILPLLSLRAKSPQYSLLSPSQLGTRNQVSKLVTERKYHQVKFKFRVKYFMSLQSNKSLSIAVFLNNCHVRGKTCYGAEPLVKVVDFSTVPILPAAL
jgi:hypothetical protein